MTIVERLLAETKELWEQYNQHPFVLGIQNGTLDREKFRYYIMQDYLYLEEYAKVFAIGVAKAKSLKTTRLFSEYIQQLTGTEMEIHHGYMGKFAVTQEQLDQMGRSLENISYTSYMIRVAYEESEVEILTAILSCAYSYQVIAQNIVKNNANAIDDEFYGEWIKGYVSEQYAKSNRILIDTLNELAQTMTKEQQQHLVDIFCYCSKYELAFWDMSYKN